MKNSKTGPVLLSPYSPEIEKKMKDTYISLSEKERRKYAAVEAIKLPHGGITYIAGLFRCGRKTVHIGIKELNDPENTDKNRIRRVGGGRKSAIDTIRNINAVFLEVIEDHTAGDPMDSNIKQTNLSQRPIAEKMKEKGIEISAAVIKKLLKINNFKKRKALKNKAIGSNNNRDKQFRRIDELKTEYLESDNPILGIDTKKKEFSGNLYREGKLYHTESVEVYDHDFPHPADGVIIPYTIYDFTSVRLIIE
ncbi:ISAzo13 family transposase [Desulfococcaceae bacterium HSG7]|nr:ISAzo13 family transposase [Desulfococcaceae bacterium HSG7]